MDLFNDLYDCTENLLPKEGIVNYFGQIMTDNQANLYYKLLLNEID